MDVRKNYERKFEFQKNVILRQTKQIESLRARIEELNLEIEEKDELINSVAHLKEELSQNVEQVKKHREEYGELIKELRMMKEIMNQEVFKGKWRLIKWLLR